MNRRFLIAIFILLACVSSLIYAGVTTTAKAVVTVKELESGGDSRERVRLGARVAEGEITSASTPEFIVQFTVHDPGVKEPQIPVVYHGLMPDTLKQGRDVILEGDFDGKTFVAKSLLTQCPSKYQPPVPKG